MKKIIKLMLPEPLLRYITGFFYGWNGNYKSWEEAKKKSTGYDAKNILEIVKTATLKVKNGEAAYERDSVLFYEKDYTYPILASLSWIAARNRGKLHILDFGGALGSTYFQYKHLFKGLNVKWCVIEQNHFVKTGKQHFLDESLFFYHSIEECLSVNQIDLVLLSGVIQYLEKPFDWLTRICSQKVQYILFDRTPFIKKPDRITVQKVHPKIYKAKYPCWFFNEDKFLKFMQNSYQLIFEFDALDKANLPSRFKGYLFKIKN